MSVPYDVDVVILSWNRAQDTIDAVRSALLQVGVEVMISVIDQGSDPHNLQVLTNVMNSFKNVNLVRLGKNYGVPAGRNRGIASGTADIVVCLDNDAVFKNEKCLQQVQQEFAADPALAVVGFRIENYNNGELDRLSWVYPRSLLEHSYEGFLATRFCGAGHALRRRAFESVGGYDEKLFFYWEELDLSYRLINSGFQIKYQPGIGVRHKVSPEARTGWQESRYMFLVRNAIYIDWKYFHSIKRLLAMVTGYFIKGVYNGLVFQAIQGIREGLALCNAVTSKTVTLTVPARRYIQTHDFNYRGGVMERIKQEILEKVP